MQTIQPGSKMDKLVKLLKAARAVGELAPWAGGLDNADPELMNIRRILDDRFDAQAKLCGLSETEALRICSEHLDS